MTRLHSNKALLPAGRRTLAVAAALASAGLLLAACSSGSEPAATASATPSAVESTSAVAEPEVIVDTTSPAALACAAYFTLDLLNSTYAGGAVEDGDLTEKEVKADFKASLKEMVAQGKVAVADGTLDVKFLNNAERMKKSIAALSKSDSLSDLPKKKAAKFATQSTRVQKACVRAGFDLPVDNTTARTAAGLG